MDNPTEILAALRALGIVPPGIEPKLELLPGGVSSSVYRLDLPSGAICVKQALARLKVTADWRAPVDRVHNEVKWFRFAASVVPGSAPTVHAEDRDAHLFVMSYFEPGTYPCWKDLLRDGAIDPSFAAKVGATIARIHAASAGSRKIENEFAYDDYFMALRIEPYLLHTARAHPDRSERIQAIANSVAHARIALMHGDFSPKNILAGPEGPVILDAETACYGDPAFDLAFCLNHLLLKCVWRPQHVDAYCASFVALRDAYFSEMSWETPSVLEKRAMPLLAALLLARIDGKSPVEYLTGETDRNFVRQTARGYLMREMTLEEMLADWNAQIIRRAP